jgi:predicted MFS family arabinose efflux permease
MDKTGTSIGIIGGVGLGLMLGSEFSGRYITILGAILVVISLISMGFLSYKGKK